MAEPEDVDTLRAPAGVGARLRRAREEKGLALADVAARTRVSERHLTAIEEGRFGDLASRTYAVGFARAFARHVGLDEIAVADEVRAEMDRFAAVERPRAVTFDPGDPARVPSRSLAWIAALLAIAVAAGVFYWWRSYYDPAAPLDDIGTIASEPAAAGSSQARAVTPPAPAPSGPVIFTAMEPGLWVKFYDGAGRQLMQKQMAQGESYTVPADAAGPKLWTGRADALAITVGGRQIAPISTGPGKVKDVPVDAASLLRRGVAAGALGGAASSVATPAPTGPLPSTGVAP